jgi:hypothetical protein
MTLDHIAEATAARTRGAPVTAGAGLQSMPKILSFISI